MHFLFCLEIETPLVILLALESYLLLSRTVAFIASVGLILQVFKLQQKIQALQPGKAKA